jgi:hypothetical protein
VIARLRVVPPTPAPAGEKVRQRIKSATPACIVECRCGSREVIEVRTGVLYVAGKTKGGTKQLLCAACFRKGERVVLV